MHGPTGNITVLSTYGRKYGENKWSKLHSYFFWKQFKLMILNFFCPVYIYIHTIFNLYQQYRHSMAVPSVTNAQGQVSVIQMQWSPEAGAKGTLTKLTIVHISNIYKKKKNKQTKKKHFSFFYKLQ